jgi:hypothetical protein
MKHVKLFEAFLTEASYPKEATSLAKKVGGKVEPHFDLDDVYFISNDKDLNIMWSKESGYEVSNDDGKDLYHGDDMQKAEKAIKENNSTVNEASKFKEIKELEDDIMDTEDEIGRLSDEAEDPDVIDARVRDIEREIMDLSGDLEDLKDKLKELQ